MGTITERQRQDGSVAFMAQIVRKRDRKVIHRENKTFDRRAAAKAWIDRREKELAQPGGMEAARSRISPTLGDAIDRYLKESEQQIGRTKAQVLRTIKTYDIADQKCADIGSPDIISFARDLTKAQALKPQTVTNYLSHLSAIFAIARPAWDYPLDRSAMQDAFTVARRLGLTGKGKGRMRRPTLAELEALLDYFAGQQKAYPDSIPMARITGFALFSTRRQEEITRLSRTDLDEGSKRILVRDMKHPGQKLGNDVWCDLPEPALKILLATPGGTGPFFPVNHRTVSARFTRACHVLEIKDLHFHDLRHEGVTRLFEMGWNIPHVAAVSGHRSWSSLKGYTHIRKTGDKYEKWAWTERLADPKGI